MGIQNYSSESSWRLFHFVFSVDVDGGVLLYHPLSRCVVFIQNGKFSDENVIRFLVQLWFLVPKSNDDKQLIGQYKDLLCAIDAGGGAITGYTILPTTDCNARCWYCFEQGVKHVFMTKDIAKQTALFIKEHHGNKLINIEWYGGEPLYNVPAIDTICKKLCDYGIHYVSSMISNAWLFNPFVTQKARKLWHLRALQVTIDGSRDVYNRTKSYVYRNKDAYMRVINNIRNAINEGIAVNIRINYDPRNIDSIKEFVSNARSLFGDNTNQMLHIYTHSLYESECDNNNQQLSLSEYRRAINLSMVEIRKEIRRQGFEPAYGSQNILTSDLPVQRCMATSVNWVGIMPDGSLTRCNHAIDYCRFGDIWHGLTDKVAFHRSEELYPELPICDGCAYYTDCIRLKCCVESGECDNELKQRRLDHIKRDMLATYQKWKKNQFSS